MIRAPIDEIVQSLELRNAQQVVQASEVIGYLSPLQSPLVMKAAVSHDGRTVRVNA